MKKSTKIHDYEIGFHVGRCYMAFQSQWFGGSLKLIPRFVFDKLDFTKIVEPDHSMYRKYTIMAIEWLGGFAGFKFGISPKIKKDG
jgi:hypothetical protein